MGKNSRFGSGIRIRDEHPGSLKFFDSDPNTGSGIFLTLDPGWKNADKHS